MNRLSDKDLRRRKELMEVCTSDFRTDFLTRASTATRGNLFSEISAVLVGHFLAKFGPIVQPPKDFLKFQKHLELVEVS